MPKSIDDETREILLSFISEGYERLDDSEAQLAKLGDGDDTARLNSVFRLFHSVKGSAGYLGLENIKRLTHEAETLLDVFLKEKIPATQDALDVVYATIDVLRNLIGITEREYSDETGAKESSEQTAKITAMIAKLRAEKGNPPAKETGEIPKDPCDTMPNEINLTDLVTRDMAQRFVGECADLIDHAEKTALSINPRESATEGIHDIFRAIHTIKGNS